MKYHELKQKIENLIVFSPNDIDMIDPSFRLPTLYEWEKKGLVIKLRSNNYIFSDINLEGIDYYLIANKLYEPSYVSLESALSYYGIIPESVPKTTSITTNKTNSFDTPKGDFLYTSIKKELFFGYKIIEHRNHGVMVASLEKTILDYLYQHHEMTELDDFTGVRWNKETIMDNLNQETIDKYLAVFDNKSLNKRYKILRNYLDA